MSCKLWGSTPTCSHQFHRPITPCTGNHLLWIAFNNCNQSVLSSTSLITSCHLPMLSTTYLWSPLFWTIRKQAQEKTESRQQNKELDIASRHPFGWKQDLFTWWDSLETERLCWGGVREASEVSCHCNTCVTSSPSCWRTGDCVTLLLSVLQPCPLAVVWVGLGRSGNGSDAKTRPRSHTSIKALIFPLMKQSCFVNHLCGLTLAYELHKEMSRIVNCICTA